MVKEHPRLVTEVVAAMSLEHSRLCSLFLFYLKLEDKILKRVPALHLLEVLLMLGVSIALQFMDQSLWQNVHDMMHEKMRKKAD